MNFCSNCGAKVIRGIPEGDNRERYCCDACTTIHYQNPRVVVGTIPIWGDQVLLCKRAIEPRSGYWTLPAGFLEVDETMAQGAVRETMEEAGARITLDPLFTVLDVVHAEQIHVFYRATLRDTDFDPGPESQAVQLYREDQIPWQDLAFPTVAMTLKLYFSNLAQGRFDVHTAAVTRTSMHPHRAADFDTQSIVEPSLLSYALLLQR